MAGKTEGNMRRALFIFRRDLRLYDNRGLLAAMKEAEEVVLSFIFTQEQIANNPFRSDAALQFMIESLQDLAEEIRIKGGKLFFFYGDPEKIVRKCVVEAGIEAVFVNRDYTPYSQNRDMKIEQECKDLGIAFNSFEDVLLHPLEETLNKSGKPYKIFTPFYKHLLQYEVLLPRPEVQYSIFKGKISCEKPLAFLDTLLSSRKRQQKGGRGEALKILSTLKQCKDDEKTKDLLAQDNILHLSPHLKFTTVSIREVYTELKKIFGTTCSSIRSLYWREFFTLIAYHFPYVFTGAFKKQYDAVPWNNNEEDFKRWCEGTTGFPIVDAGMRELNETGFMPNRARLITASFLVKDLHIHWQWGERYFATHLIDYDPAVNNGNWQWVASTGCDAQPYFRVFNPILQGKRFDPEALYIKKWVKELALHGAREIHCGNCCGLNGYPAPMIDHEKEVKKSLKLYRT